MERAYARRSLSGADLVWHHDGFAKGGDRHEHKKGNCGREAPATSIDVLGIAGAFGLTIVAMACGIG